MRLRSGTLLVLSLVSLLSAQQLPTGSNSAALEVVRSVTADFPVLAKQNGRQGSVILRVSVAEDGTVTDATPESGDPIFREPAIAAAKKWVFRPFLQGGKAATATTTVPIDFILSAQVAQKGKLPLTIDTPNDAPAFTSKGVQLPDHVRVSEGVSQGLLLRSVTPVYPYEAKTRGIQGPVVVQAMIRTDGLVGEVTPVSGPKELIQAALDAASLWRYRPYLIEGHPIKVQTTILFVFRR